MGRLARGFAGVLAGGFVVLTIALVGAQVWATSWGQEGPGAAALTGHLIAAAATIVLQVFADRAYERRGDLATAAVYVLVLGSLWYWWW